jgi:hypothetical protein
MPVKVKAMYFLNRYRGYNSINDKEKGGYIRIWQKRRRWN